MTTTTETYFQTIVNDVTESTSITTGCFQTLGGIGVTKNGYFGGDVCALGNICGIGTGMTIFGGDASTEDLILRGNSAATDGTVFVNDVTGNTTAGNGALVVAGGASIGENLTVVGTTSISGGTLTGVTTALTIHGSDQASDNLVLSSTSDATKGSVQVVGGVGSTSSTSGQLTVTGGAGISENLYVGGTINAIGNINGTLGTAAQPNVTSLGTLTSLQVDNININGNTITSTDANGNITLTPNGTGEVRVPTITSSSDANSAANKGYVDAVVTGLDVKNSCRVVTDAVLPSYSNVDGPGIGAKLVATANGAFPTVDGVTLVANDRILVDDNGTTGPNASDRGIYTLDVVGDGSTAWELIRATDADEDTEVTSGLFTFIEEGTVGANCGHILVTPDPITVDTTALSFTQFSGAGANSLTNVGTGVGVFRAQVGSVFEMRSLSSSDSTITIAVVGAPPNDDDIDIIVNQSNIDHGSLNATSLTDDDHTQYALLAGRGTNQTLSGGTATTNTLSLRGNATDLTTGEVAVLTTKDASGVGDAALTVDGGASVAKKLFVGDDVTLSAGAIFTNNDVTDASAIGTAANVFVGGVSVAQQLRVGNDVTLSAGAIFTNNDLTDATNLTTAANVMLGGLAVSLQTIHGDDVNLNAGALLISSDTTDSSSTGTGSIQTLGGLGVALSAHIGEDVTTPIVYGSTSASANLTLTSTSNATKGEVIITDNLNHQGSIMKLGPTATHVGHVTGKTTTIGAGTADLITIVFQTGTDQFITAKFFVAMYDTSAGIMEHYIATLLIRNASGSDNVTATMLFDEVVNTNFVISQGVGDATFKLQYTTSGAGDVATGFVTYTVGGPNHTSDLASIGWS